MFTKFAAVLFVTLLCASDLAIAAESVYVGNQRFMPLPPPSRMAARTQVVVPPAKFMPLDPSRLPPIRLAAKPTIDSLQPSEVPPRPANMKPAQLKNMSPEQAQQLLSIYNQSK